LGAQEHKPRSGESSSRPLVKDINAVFPALQKSKVSATGRVWWRIACASPASGEYTFDFRPHVD